MESRSPILVGPLTSIGFKSTGSLTTCSTHLLSPRQTVRAFANTTLHASLAPHPTIITMHYLPPCTTPNFLSCSPELTSKLSTRSLKAVLKQPSMQRLYDLKSKFNNLTVNTASVASSASDTSLRNNARQGNREAARPKYPIRKPTMRLFPETQDINPLPMVKIVTKHSHGFNSERATGLNKLQQLQFVEQLKGMIVGTIFCSPIRE